MKNVLQVRNAVREYDPDLDFGRNEKTGQWCIFLKRGTNELTKEADLPVLGFEDIPHPHDALKRLYRSDALRTGRDILEKLERNNAEIHKKKDEAAQEGEEAAAEAFEWGFRQMGASPVSKIYIP